MYTTGNKREKKHIFYKIYYSIYYCITSSKNCSYREWKEKNRTDYDLLGFYSLELKEKNSTYILPSFYLLFYFFFK